MASHTPSLRKKLTHALEKSLSILEASALPAPPDVAVSACGREKQCHSVRTAKRTEETPRVRAHARGILPSLSSRIPAITTMIPCPNTDAIR